VIFVDNGKCCAVLVSEIKTFSRTQAMGLTESRNCTTSYEQLGFWKKNYYRKL